VANYCFTDTTRLKLFLERVRERELVASFLPLRIYEDKEVVTQLKVLRLWKRTAAYQRQQRRRSSGAELREAPITMTFLARRPRGQETLPLKHEELSLTNLRTPATRNKKMVGITNMRTGTVLKFQFETEKGENPILSRSKLVCFV
jgi:hypothetical protein